MQRSKIHCLFDHLVGTQQDRSRQLNVECLGDLEINDQLEFGGLLDRQMGGLRTLENASVLTLRAPRHL